MNAFGFLAFAAASLGALWVGIDVGREPPMVLAEGPWVEGCERVGETLRVEVAEDAPDLRFDFVGLPEGAEVAMMHSTPRGRRLAEGWGCGCRCHAGRGCGRWRFMGWMAPTSRR